MQPKMFVGMALVLIFAEVLGEFFFSLMLGRFGQREGKKDRKAEE